MNEIPLSLECQVSLDQTLTVFFFLLSLLFLSVNFMTLPFSKSLPLLVHVDDILFRKPVEIGSLLYFSSQVVYTQGQFVMVRVSAEVVQVIFT